jgi:redox-sensitive bicupin YhaK (pirin superfamily)
METVFHSANSRGDVNHGWLHAKHSFSFGSWYNPERIHFGALRVLNDDIVAAGMGFGTHPHDNMEIITIPLSGAIAHKDSMGNASTIKTGEIQVMSAGTGIQHSEFNPINEELNLFQIWIFPNQKNVTPRYDQFEMDVAKMKNNFLQLVSPNQNDEGTWIHQNAWIHIAEIDENTSLNYALKDPSNGVYFMVVHGELKINDQQLNQKDALGVWNTTTISITTQTKSKIVAIEVPMQFDY